MQVKHVDFMWVCIFHFWKWFRCWGFLHTCTYLSITQGGSKQIYPHLCSVVPNTKCTSTPGFYRGLKMPAWRFLGGWFLHHAFIFDLDLFVILMSACVRRTVPVNRITGAYKRHRFWSSPSEWAFITRLPLYIISP